MNIQRYSARSAGTGKALICLLAFASAALAQSTTGSFQGTVTGPTGAAVPAATVTIRNPATGQSRSTTTNASGDYDATLMQPGAYDITVESPGFQRFQKTGIQLLVNQNIRVDFPLQISSLQESVTVEAFASLVDTQDSAVRQVVEEKQIVDLPLNGRSFRSLGLTVPGVSDMAQGSVMATRGGGMNIVGAKDTQNNFLLDGFDNNDPTTGETLTFPTIDGIQEFGVEGANYGADVGFASGGIVTLVTRSGTSRYHGTLFEFLRNDKLNGRNFFAAGAPPLKKNQFGGVFGGHFPRSKRLFFFGGYESTVDHEGITQAATVPTAAVRGGNFAGIANVVDPLNGAPFANNLIPASRFNSIGNNIVQQLFPLPNAPGLVSNYISNPSVPNNLQVSTARVDFAQSEKNTYFARLSQYWQTTDDTSPGPYQIIYNQLIKHSYNIGAEWTHVFGPRTVQELRVGRGWVDNEIFVKNQQNWDQILGIPGPTLGLTAPNQISGGPPIVNLTGYSSMATRSNPFIRIHHLWQAAYQLSHNVGNHQLRIGGEYRHYRMDITDDANPQGTFTFTGQYAKNAVADLLLGYPASTANLIGPELNDELNWQMAEYIQDNWKVSRKLTLNLGFRYEFQSPDTSSTNTLGGFVPSLGKAVQVGTNGLPPGIRNAYHKNLAPRLGFAWDPSGRGKTSVRGGYGIYYESLTHATNEPSGFTSYPIAQSGQYTANATSPNISLSSPFPAALAGSVFAASGYDPNYHGGRTQRWQVGLQQAIGVNGVAEVTYVGATTSGEFHSYNLNQPAPGPGTAAQIAARRPYPTYSTITWSDGTGESRYKAVLAKYEQRMTKGFTGLVSYSFGNTRDNTGGTNQDPLNRAADWGDSAFNVKQRLVMSLTYALQAKNVFVKGWQISTISTLSGGNPTTAALSIDNANIAGTNQRPNQNGDPNNGAPHTATQWFNTSVFSIPAQYTFGNAPRSSITGPGMESVDISIMRTFRIRERFSLDVRAEGFDMLNHANFNLPITTANSPSTFGRITSAKDPREFQIGMKFHF